MLLRRSSHTIMFVMDKRLQNRIGESRFTLPVVFVYGIAVWIVAGLVSNQQWVSFGCFIISSYLMVELNNSNALIRTYSRMVSSSFIMLMCSACFLFDSMQNSITEVAFIACYELLFRGYQNRDSSPWAFYAFMCLSLGSITFVPVMFYVPFLWLMMATYLRSFSLKTFIASILGLLVPYWFLAGYDIFMGNLGSFVDHFTDIASFYPLVSDGYRLKFISLIDFANEKQIETIIFVLILAMTGIIHYKRTSYKDKIHVRMIYNVLIFMTILTFVFMFLQPQYYDVLLRLLIVGTAPLIAHYLTLTRTWLTNLSFFMILIVVIALTVYNLLPLSLLQWVI